MSTRAPALLAPKRPFDDAVPVTPTVEAWRTMTAEQRLDFQVAVNEALTAAAFMSEGRPHKRAVRSAIDALGLHFRTTGRVVYFAEDMSVLYPGEKGFSPDILAVLDVPQPDDDERMSWAVAVEGKGPDVVIEVLHRGDRDKDLVKNVERFARLGIPEYFVYDRAQQRIHGYRLPAAARTTRGPSSYQPIVPQRGHYRSNVLAIDLAILDDELRFLVGEALLPVSADVIERLEGIQESLAAKARAEGERDATRANILALLDARGLAAPDEARTRIEGCTDPATLRRWLLRAATASTSDEVFALPVEEAP